ncbi:MAG: NYN domain-containing protein, partial [Promethearchaeota archaeon]
YPMSHEKKRWYSDLSNKSGYVIKASFDKMAINDTFEKKVDIKIAVDMVSLAYENKYDIAILVSGDGDFVPVIKKIKDLDKSVELWAFKYSLANTLKEQIELSKIFYLDDILDKIKM